MSDLAERFNNWLAERFDPDRTQSGSIRRQSGVHVYPPEVQRKIRRLLGGSFGAAAIRKARAGDGMCARLRSRIERVVELEDPEAILARVRDDQLYTELRHARKIHSISGSAPDGGDLELWVRRRREALDEEYGVDAPLEGEAAELWSEIVGMPEIPPVNRQRRARRVA